VSALPEVLLREVRRCEALVRAAKSRADRLEPGRDPTATTTREYAAQRHLEQAKEARRAAVALLDAAGRALRVQEARTLRLEAMADLRRAVAAAWGDA
jgi:hypothetical protein